LALAKPLPPHPRAAAANQLLSLPSPGPLRPTSLRPTLLWSGPARVAFPVTSTD